VRKGVMRRIDAQAVLREEFADRGIEPIRRLG
jgi:hypothetical protein